MRYAIAHIADIHYRKDEPEGALTILRALVDDLRTQKASLPGYQFYLAITGDIVFAAKDIESYSTFYSEFDSRLNDIGLTTAFRIVVPGNHDIDQSVLEADLSDYQGIPSNAQTEAGFNDFISATTFSDHRFDNYFLFEAEFAQYGIGYRPHGNGWALNDDLAVYCLNTSLSSLAGLGGTDRLAIYTRGLVEWCTNSVNSTRILLMHHPISHLVPWSKDSLRQIIEKYFRLCLCGHCHQQDIYYNKISQQSLICSAPQVFTNTADLLGYAIILIDNGSIDKIVYREYIKGHFYNGQRFSESTDGVVSLQSEYISHLEMLDHALQSALSFFKSQPVVFVKPKFSKEREFNKETNLLDEIIENPRPLLILSHPQFGLTCLSHYMRIEAYKANAFWIYLDSSHVKARHVHSNIDAQLKEFGKKKDDIKCIIIDSWDSSSIDHRNILKCIDTDYKDIPILLMVNYSTLYYDCDFNFSALNTAFETVHLQAMERQRVREFVSQYNQQKNIDTEDVVVERVVRDLEALNVHRTPFNCLTLLKVFERDFSQNLVNRTKMIKAVLFILFTDADSFTYSTNKPDVDDCEYILGRFCKTLIEKRARRFTRNEFVAEVNAYCQEKLINVDLAIILDILVSNNILLRFNDFLEFKHTYWIYYFAATYMLLDDAFADYILDNKNYVNFPEIIEFFTGTDGRRDKAVHVLLTDLIELNKTVENRIGITGEFNPFESCIWQPSEASIEALRKEISEKVKKSKLPVSIKDQHADEFYDSEAPYDQSISNFLTDYSVVSLINSIKAASRALRNSNYVDPDLKRQMVCAILNGWEQMSKVLFWVSPALSQKGSVVYDGLLVFLGESFDEANPKRRLQRLYESNPVNVVMHFKDDLSSKKIGPLLFECLEENESVIQKHLLSLFLIKERPNQWYKRLFDFMNLLHRNSFILGDLHGCIRNELDKGFVSQDDSAEMRRLLKIVVAKHEYAPRVMLTEIPKDRTISQTNKLQIDKIIAAKRNKGVAK